MRAGPGEVLREAHQSIPIPRRRSTVAPFLQPSLSVSSAVRPRLLRRPASSHHQPFLFFLSRKATCFDQDDAVGLNAFDYHLLEKRMLLEAACVQTNAPSRSSHLRGPSIPPAWKQRSTCSSSQACLPGPHACCAYPSAAPSVPERQLPATPAVGPLSSAGESTVPMLWHLWRCLKPAQTVLVFLLCPTSSAHDIHCIDTYCGGCGAVAAPCLFDAAFKLTTTTQHNQDSQRL